MTADHVTQMLCGVYLLVGVLAAALAVPAVYAAACRAAGREERPVSGNDLGDMAGIAILGWVGGMVLLGVAIVGGDLIWQAVR